MKLRLLRLLCFTILGVFLVLGFGSCRTTSQTEAQKQSDLRIAELTRKLDKSSRDLSAATTQVQQLEEAIRSLNSQITDLQEKDKKNQTMLKTLGDQKANLEQLLAQVQTLQLSSVISTAAPKTEPAPLSETSPPKPTDLWPRPAELVVENTIAKSRTERKNIPGTPLFSERDTTNGIVYYYHRILWYQTLGIHIEIAQFARSEWGARLVVETASLGNENAKNATLSFFLPSTNGVPEQTIATFGTPDDSMPVRGLEKPVLSLWYQLTPTRLKDLAHALENPGAAWRISAVGDSGTTVDQGPISETTRKALQEMIVSIDDLKSSTAY